MRPRLISDRDIEGFRVIWPDEIGAEQEGLWLIEGILPLTGLAALYGHPGAGKTFLALDLALHIATGSPWFGHLVERSPVLYVAAEGGRALSNRIMAWRIKHGVQGEDFALVRDVVDLVGSHCEPQRFLSTLRGIEVRFGRPPALVVIDTLAMTFGGGRENTDDMAVYVAHCRQIANEADVTILIIHHRPRSDERAMRGHGSLAGALDTSLICERKSKQLHKVTIDKQRDGPRDISFLFELEGVDVGGGHQSMVVKPLDGAGAIAPDVHLEPGRYECALRQFDKVLARDDRRKPGEGLPRDSIWEAEWQALALIEYADVQRESALKRHRRALRALEDRGFISVVGGWATRLRQR